MPHCKPLIYKGVSKRGIGCAKYPSLFSFLARYGLFTGVPTMNAITTLSKVFATKFADDAANTAIRVLIEQTCRGWSDGETVKAADLRLSAEDSKALSSASFTAQTFIKGIAHRLALFAHGQTLERVQEGLTPQAQFALVAASRPLKQGAGLTVAQLRDCLTIGMRELLALPLKEAAPKKKAVAQLIQTTGDATDAATDATDATEDAAHKRGEQILALHEQAGILADYARHEANERLLENARASAYGAAAASPDAPSRTTREAAIELCRLADQLGIKLTKAQIALLNKAEKAIAA
jgi:hypothetical protein